MNRGAQFRGPAPRDVNAIERQNEQIRSDMGEAIEALQRKFSPGQLLDRALNLTKEHGGEWASNLGNSVKQNPMPALLTAVGLVWMIGTQGRGPVRRGDDVERDDSALREKTEGVREALGGAKSRIREAGERIGETAASASARLRSSAATLKDSARSASERTQALAGSARDQGRRAKETFDTVLHDQPLAIAAVGVGLGALLGSLLPATEQEDRLMGTARDRALDRARAAGEKQYARARETASRAMQDVEQRAAAQEEQPRPH